MSVERNFTQSELNAALALRTQECAHSWDNHTIPSTFHDIYMAIQNHILALIKPDESAALAEHDRRVRAQAVLDTLMDVKANLPVNPSYWWMQKIADAEKEVRWVALRGTGEEKQP